MAKQGKEEVSGVQDEEGEEKRAEVVTRRNDAAGEQGTRETDNSEKDARGTPEKGELGSTVEGTMRVGRDGGGEVGERASRGRKGVAGRRSANRVEDLAPCKSLVFIHDHTTHRRVGGCPARKNNECRHLSNKKSTGSRGRSTPSACSARSARRGSSDITTPCNSTGVGIIRGEGQGIHTTSRQQRTTGGGA